MAKRLSEPSGDKVPPMTLEEFSRRGGHARRDSLTPQRRKAIASAAAFMRWKVYRQKRRLDSQGESAA